MAVSEAADLQSQKDQVTAAGALTGDDLISHLGSQQRIDRDRACAQLRARLRDSGARSYACMMLAIMILAGAQGLRLCLL